MSFERHLMEQGLVTAGDLEKARRHSSETGASLNECLRRLGTLDGGAIARAASVFYKLPLIDEADWPRSLAAAGGLSRPYLREQRMLPLGMIDGALAVATADPGNTRAIDALRLATGAPLALRVAAAEDIEAAFDRLATDEAIPTDSEVMPVTAETAEEVEQLKDLASGAPVIRLVNQMLVEALHTRATDIHIEPMRRRLIVRQRIDGMLREMRSPPPELARAIISRIKILSGLDIAERRLPQDGRARLRIEGRSLDLRVATVPTINGESVAIRILENTQRSLDLAQLGFDANEQRVLNRHLLAPYGLILVTGPTGSGKTTTLAASLTILNEPTRKILTIEDPIEYQIDGINQIQVKPEIGVTFAHTLRSFLRNDPDVIMVGELRDTETARIAVQAALTGHLVLSTLHTNSAPGAVTRLLDMGVDAYLLASCLRCVVGQRLVRTLCRHCRQPHEAPIDLPADFLIAAGLEPGRSHAHWRAVGCDRCFNSGFVGRTGILELLEFNEELQRLVKPDVATRDIVAAATRSGMRLMAVDGIGKCVAGVTTPDEVRRVAMEA